tara:strand:- start:113 stop:1051 length:939 start_codon:yes stop_codon:yes gene_type:complete
VIDKTITDISDVPLWNYDGSSTYQSESKDSEIILKPVLLTPNPFFKDTEAWFVLCELMTNSGVSIDTRNAAVKQFDLKPELKPKFGIEQEFFLMCPLSKRPLGFPKHGYPEEQGKYYCSVGYDRCFKRNFLDEALEILLKMGVPLTGYNMEVCPGQMELQVCADGILAADYLMLTRYVLNRLGEKHQVLIEFGSKPVKGDWNGSGCHVNFSTTETMKPDNYKVIVEYIEKLRLNHTSHIELYGTDNCERLTGKHETSDLNTFTYGVGNRNVSIRIPNETFKNQCGYIEDRRPSSSCDPYLVTSKIFQTCCLD